MFTIKMLNISFTAYHILFLVHGALTLVALIKKKLNDHILFLVHGALTLVALTKKTMNGGVSLVLCTVAP